jgi:hypothetical protein
MPPRGAAIIIIGEHRVPMKRKRGAHAGGRKNQKALFQNHAPEIQNQARTGRPQPICGMMAERRINAIFRTFSRHSLTN